MLKFSCSLVVLALVLSGCGGDPESAQEPQAVPRAEASQAPAVAADSGSVTFDVELIGGEAEGTYQVASDNRCMAIVNAPDAQLNVNAFSEDSTLSYAQLSVYGLTAEGGESDLFIFIAKTNEYELRIDTDPDSLIGQSATGTVSWRLAGRQEIDFRVEATHDDSVEVRATVTCRSPSWTGI